MHPRTRTLLAAAAFFCASALAGCRTDTDPAATEALLPIDCAANIEVEHATLEGVRDGTACAFRGVPFAQPPVGSLRFLPPQPIEKHAGTLVGDKFEADCVQSPTFYDVPVAEDCLYLNVWIPGESADGQLRREMPVMVFYYGGGFTAGGGSWAFYNGEKFTTHGVILVTVNYRLGPLGYLAPSNVTDASGFRLDGNLGLQDQTEALRWVQKNIAAFGGDPKRVTIFGESAGAWSTCDLLASSETDGLFQRAIMESGECHVGNRSETAAKADAWIAKAGCPVTGPTALACLRNLDASEIPGIGYSMGGGNYPNVDGKVLTDQPLTLLRSGKAKGVQLIAGYNREETNALRHLPDHVERIRMSFPEYWEKAAAALTPAQIKRAQEVYGDATYSDPMALATEMMNDIIFTCPAFEAVKAQAKNGAPAWHYRFSVGDDEMILEPFLGTFHALEIPYVFGNTEILVFAYNDNAAYVRMREMSDRIQRYWTRFAATGDPNGGDDPYWPQFAEDKSRMELTVAPEVTRGQSDARCAFWDETAPIGLGERFAFIKQVVGFNPIE